MISALRNPTYARLFTAQVIALLGTGLLTVALGLLAFEIAGGAAGAVLGTALAIKMVAYVFVSPLTGALTASLPRTPVLVGADLVRAGVALALPFVDQAWQIYVLIFVLQSASATFTPAFQAVIPTVLPDERDFTAAQSLSRLAYDLESLVSPALAAALLTALTFHDLFLGTVLGFLASAALVLIARLPRGVRSPEGGFWQRATQGVRMFAASRELRGLASVNLTVAATSAFVFVNTVVLVQAVLSRPQSDVAVLLAAFGGGSMLVALGLPGLLARRRDLRVMTLGALVLPAVLTAVAVLLGRLDGAGESRWAWPALLVLWALLGAATSLVATPSARLLRRASTEENRSAVFAGQFSLSHACFLLTYPVAGVLGASLGLGPVALVLVVLAVIGLVGALLAWGRGPEGTDLTR